jgi:hypothetical protein
LMLSHWLSSPRAGNPASAPYVLALLEQGVCRARAPRRGACGRRALAGGWAGWPVNGGGGRGLRVCSPRLQALQLRAEGDPRVVRPYASRL